MLLFSSNFDVFHGTETDPRSATYRVGAPGARKKRPVSTDTLVTEIKPSPALADSRDHLLATLRMLESDRATLRAREARIAALETQVEDYRQQLATVIARAVTRNRALALAARKPRPPPNRPQSQSKPKRRVIPKKPARRPKSKGRAKR
jgi:hypothetical protein